MIDVIHYLNESIEKPLVPKISEYYDEVCKLLPGLPETLQIYFSDYGIIPETGVGGFAYSHDIVTISIDPEFKDKERQFKDIRPKIFHEVFHLYQHFTSEDDSPLSAIEDAIYEGMATVFERDYEGTLQPYGDYREASLANLKYWVSELEKIGSEYYEDKALFQKWKFYNKDLKERWISYKVGVWIVDQVLMKKKLTILDLKDRTAKEVFALYNQ